MKAYLLALLLALSTHPLCAEEKLALVRPDATKTLKVKKVERSHGIYAEFEGKVSISGTLVAQWIRGVDEEEDNTLDVRLIPDEATIQGLPYFDRYPVRKIDIENEAETLRLTIEAATLSRLKRKDLKIVRATGEFVLSDYVVGVECDAPWAKGKVLSSKIPRPLNLAGKPLLFGC